MPITLKSTGGGSVSIDVPSTGSTFTLTAPANNATIFTTDGGAITGNVAFTSNNISIGGQTISPAVGMRNRIINGNMAIDQRNGGASSTPSGTSAGTYTLDRWVYQASQTGKFTVQQNAGSVTPPAGFSSYLGLTSTSSYSTGAGDYFNIYQCIEGNNISDLDFGKSTAKSITLSFWVRSSLTGTFGGGLRNGALNRTYPFTYTISSANTWTYITIVISGDTTGTWVTDNTQGIYITWSLGIGSTYSGGTVNTWNVGNYQSASGPVSVVGTNGATWYITGVQLEAGTVATPFERRLYGTELALCQRYLPAFNSAGTTTALGGGYCNSTNAVQLLIAFPVQARVAPTGATISSASHITWASTGANVATVAGMNISSTWFGAIALTVVAISGQGGQGFFNNASGQILFTGCEL